jgi:hypothetical protein
MSRNEQYRHIGPRAWVVTDSGVQIKGTMDHKAAEQIKFAARFARAAGVKISMALENGNGKVVTGEIFVEHKIGDRD